jgi:phosphinothricin acetyltransferase
MPVLVRDAVEVDMGQIQAIYAWQVMYGLASFEEIPPDVDEITRRWRSVCEQGFPYVVAELDAAVAGYAYASLYRTRSAYRFTVEDSVYVERTAHGRGVGRALLTEVLLRCERMGFTQVIAVIGDGENHASIGLHAALGFEHAGVLRSVGYKHGRWVDSVLMQRSLGDS